MIVWLLKKFIYHTITFSFAIMILAVALIAIVQITFIDSENIVAWLVAEVILILFLISLYYLFRWVDRKNDYAWINFFTRLFDLDIKEKYKNRENVIASEDEERSPEDNRKVSIDKKWRKRTKKGKDIRKALRKTKLENTENKQNSETSSVNYELDQFSNKEYSADGIASTLRQFGKDYISEIEIEIKKIKETIELNNGGGKIGKDYNLINIEQLIDKSIVLEGDNE